MESQKLKEKDESHVKISNLIDLNTGNTYDDEYKKKYPYTGPCSYGEKCPIHKRKW